MPSRDPRSYVRVLPLPTTGGRAPGSGDAVSKTNYQRRQEQITSQGFWSVSHKPYRGIGDPFYLDEKKLILHSLGQWDENEDLARSSSSEDDDIQQSKTTTASRPMTDSPDRAEECVQDSMLEPEVDTAAKFVLRRTRTDLNTLHRDVANSRNLIRNVRLGYGFFDLIRQQQQAKNAAALAEKRRQLDAARREWQPPKSDSDSDSDDDLEPDVSIARFLESGSEDETGDQTADIAPGTLDSDLRGRVTFSGTSNRSRSLSAGSRRWQNVAPRPFTPQHTNLSDVSGEHIEQEALFRQLCVLNWLLEAMTTEHSVEMSPITQSWLRRESEIGGYRQPPQRSKQVDRPDRLKWEQIVTSSPMKIKKASISKCRPAGRRSVFSGPRVSVSPPPSSASSSQQPGVMTSQQPSAGSSQQPGVMMSQQPSIMTSQQPGVMTSQQPSVMTSQDRPTGDTTDSVNDDESSEPAHNKSIFGFLDEYYKSLRKESAQSQQDPGSSNVPRTRRTSEVNTKEIRSSNSEGRTSRKSVKSPDQQNTDLDDGTDKKQSFQSLREKKSLQEFRANLHMIRPKSTAALMDYKAQLPSNKHTPMTQEMRQKFSEVLEDKALSLHDILEQIDRDRMMKCQSKFMAMKAEGHNFHKNLRAMRIGSAGSTHQPTKEQLKSKSAFKRNWYTDLVTSIPPDLKEKWFYKKILKRLANFGLPKSRRKSVKVQLAQVESPSKQSVYRFVRVLGTVRAWEICSPDVRAAVEFCRSRIVHMAGDEFDDWFHHHFPSVARPHTAPGGHRGGRRPGTHNTPPPGDTEGRSQAHTTHGNESQQWSEN